MKISGRPIGEDRTCGKSAQVRMMKVVPAKEREAPMEGMRLRLLACRLLNAEAPPMQDNASAVVALAENAGAAVVPMRVTFASGVASAPSDQVTRAVARAAMKQRKVTPA